MPPMAIASTDVLCEHVAGRGVQRHQTTLAEFGAADGQHSGLEIDVLEFEVACFAKAQPRDTQEPEQTIIDPRAQCSAFKAAGHVECGA